MESNGKHVTLDGARVDYQTGAIYWGEPGTNGQHSFYQLIHQGTRLIPCDFIGFMHSQQPARRPPRPADVQRLRPDRGARLRQDAGAGARGGDAGGARPAPRLRGQPARPTRSSPSGSTPETLGALVALYEHSVFTQGTIWGIDSFDQWGVELGKALAVAIIPELQAGRRAEAAPRQLDQRADPPLPPREARGVADAPARPAPAGGVGIEPARRARADGVHARLPHRPLLPRRRPAGDDPRRQLPRAEARRRRRDGAGAALVEGDGGHLRRGRRHRHRAHLRVRPALAALHGPLRRRLRHRLRDRGDLLLHRGDLPRRLHLRVEAAQRLGSLLVRGADGCHRDRRRLLGGRRQLVDEPAAGLHPERGRQGGEHRTDQDPAQPGDRVRGRRT